ncbi:hypothetical protein F5X96DRAFT_640896 [Biscogniauxia mediterranea]|nr:hypothetical protein F5X96DRAFT_640896 [Biscogniauxia mediterranea]
MDLNYLLTSSLFILFLFLFLQFHGGRVEVPEVPKLEVTEKRRERGGDSALGTYLLNYREKGKKRGKKRKNYHLPV